MLFSTCTEQHRIVPRSPDPTWQCVNTYIANYVSFVSSGGVLREDADPGRQRPGRTGGGWDPEWRRCDWCGIPGGWGPVRVSPRITCSSCTEMCYVSADVTTEFVQLCFYFCTFLPKTTRFLWVNDRLQLLFMLQFTWKEIISVSITLWFELIHVRHWDSVTEQIWGETSRCFTERPATFCSVSSLYWLLFYWLVSQQLVWQIITVVS